jgi:DNA-binding SARP family transcriptional activator
LTLLGTWRLEVRGTAVRLRRTAGLQVLAYLAVHPDGATTADLLRALWPGNAPGAITKRLHTTLTDLRDQLNGLVGAPVIRRHDRYLLNTEAIDTDLSRLRRAMTAAASAVTSGQRQSALEAITSDYRGDLAAGYAWPWLQPVREQLRRDVIDAYLLMAESTDTAHAAELLHAATSVDPYNADLHHRAQALLRATGEHSTADALEQAYAQRLSAAQAAIAAPGPTPSDGR